jgi:replicative DNA helicase
MLQDLKAGKITLDDLLVPEKHISQIGIDDLRIDALPSGFPSLDDYMFLKDKRSELIIIGGRPSMGKSAFLFQLALNVAKTMPVHVFSLEMDKESIYTRLISGVINRSMQAIQKGAVSNDVLVNAKKELDSLHYFIDDRAGLNVFELSSSARDAQKRHGTKLIVVDYLQLLRTPKGHSKDDEVGSVTKELKALAKDLKVPVVVGCQLNRQCEIRGKESGDYKPILSDLRESGNIEQDSDIVAFVHRESRYTNERPGVADIIIAKNRNGPCGTVEMGFTEAQTRFIDSGGDSL